MDKILLLLLSPGIYLVMPYHNLHNQISYVHDFEHICNTQFVVLFLLTNTALQSLVCYAYITYV